MLNRINWSQVGDVIRTNGDTLMDFVLEDIARRVVETAGKYVAADLDNAQDLRLEQNLVYIPGKNRRIRKGFVDLGVLKKIGPGNYEWSLYDWKLVHSKEFKPEAPIRQRWDPAWVFYLKNWKHHKTNETVSNLFTYRNILLNPDPKDKKKGFYLVELTAQPSDYVRLEREFLYTERAIATHVKRGDKPWEQHMPSACNAFGATCPHHAECVSQTIMDFPLRNTMSPSLVKTYQLCPERARWQLQEDAGHDGDSPYASSEKAQGGTAFHAGIAEVYRQYWELLQEKK